MARPKADISEKEVLKLAALQCTKREIASFFDVSESCIGKRFSNIIAKGKDQGKITLRRYQFQLAERSAAMAIFLGKQMLDQTDKVEVAGEDFFNSRIEIIPDLSRKRGKELLKRYSN